MPRISAVLNDDLVKIRDELLRTNKIVRAWMIREELAKRGIQLDESTIRGRFIEMNDPLSGNQNENITIKIESKKPEQTQIQRIKSTEEIFNIPDSMKTYIPNEKDFVGYIERAVDKRLAIHYDSGKYPLTQGKQGTGKTFSHMYYAYKKQLPFFLFSGYEDFKLKKYFGDKTIVNGNIVFQEGIMVKALQNPSVILYDEINAITNANTFDFHALLQNRELFIKDADNGAGKVYKVHPQCRIGFAQNPKSAKYIGGNVKPSNFLGRCTYITYPEFTKTEMTKSVTKRFPTLTKDEIKKFVEFYFACCEAIEKAEIPVDISIRQLNNVIDLYIHGLPLREAIEDGLISIMEAVSQPKNQEAFIKLAEAVWKELMDKNIDEQANIMNLMILKWR